MWQSLIGNRPGYPGLDESFATPVMMEQEGVVACGASLAENLKSMEKHILDYRRYADEKADKVYQITQPPSERYLLTVMLWISDHDTATPITRILSIPTFCQELQRSEEYQMVLKMAGRLRRADTGSQEMVEAGSSSKLNGLKGLR